MNSRVTSYRLPGLTSISER